MASCETKLIPNLAAFRCQKNAAFLKERMQIWEELRSNASLAAMKPGGAITIQLGASLEAVPGVAFQTKPLDVMPKLVAKERQHNPFVAVRVFELPASKSAWCAEVVDADGEISSDEEASDAHGHLANLIPGSSDRADGAAEKYVLWDLSRPLEASCRLEFVRFDEKEGQHIFWHSSAHILGQVLELEFGGYLTMGPALQDGFYYDIFLGDHSIKEEDCNKLENQIHSMIMSANDQQRRDDAGADSMVDKMQFERLVISKADALRLFAYNPFKVKLIEAKIPDGSLTSCYRCGDLIDLCRGPHIPDLGIFSCGDGKSQLFSLHKHSSAYWLGKEGNDRLQRVYGISFPSPKKLKEWQQVQEEAKERRHQDMGRAQELFFFHDKFSPGCAFWMPHGARVYNKLCDWMRSEQCLRGFDEVITPNMFRSDIFKTSAHYWTYPERYSLNNEGEEWMLKPMNCPGHCTIFRHRVRSYKELPMRLADFGTLHRKEPSGSLSGLTRVRRFVQDDGHIFCRPDQVETELDGALDFMKYVYNVLGLRYSFVLSTRPKKAIGKREIWDNAECALAKALNRAQVKWELNKGDGAFYGPKIDILIEDITGKKIQCATIQLDFQLPLRFNLQYDDRRIVEPKHKSASAEKGAEIVGQTERQSADAREEQLRLKGSEGPLKPGFERPVMIHRAVFGSLERFSAILTEHFAGRWPFFLNPRQVMVVPVHPKHNDYSMYVAEQMRRVGGLHVDCNTDKGGNMQKKIARAIDAKYSFVAVVGTQDEENLTVTLRPRDDKEAELLAVGSPTQDADEQHRFVLPLADCIKLLKDMKMPCSQNRERFDEWMGVDPEAAALKSHKADK
eukprot:TRINITY_DN108380_c0_g1_i1.p1 TRINITY_DN108380_c0_g1~~TRINITY_DN108380_c0_g1_i1.p1  ORF type:complete len:847 (+),score=188.05 TRINITY_DN108380_c0_g1_i1:57-2597(+)